ncbi:AMP-dependent synthetase [Thiocystis violacea]|nr:AMP-dependent synthetase [Thiocystis violacea]
MGQGLASGQVVMAPDAPVMDLVVLMFALARIGAALFPFRSGLDRDGTRSLASLVGAEWYWHPDSEQLGRTPFAAPGDASAASPIGLLIKTSGSGGKPRVVMLSFESLLASASRVNTRLGLTADDTWLACLRFSHVGGVTIAYRCALAGARMWLHEGFDARAVRRDLDDGSVTHLSLVPPMLARLLDLDQRPPPALRVLLVGGQALSRPLAQRTVEAGWPLHVTYGMTETGSQIATTGRLQGRDLDPARVGDLMPDIRVAAGGCEASPAPLRIRGPVLMAGYANPRRRPGDGLEQGWFRSADLGCEEPDGGLRILGRADDVLVIGGRNVSLSQINAALQEAPGVREIQLVGLADPVWGHRLTAVFAGDCDEGELALWCRGHLRGAECPRAFRRLECLPVLDSGKYDRVRIAALAEASVERAGLKNDS